MVKISLRSVLCVEPFIWFACCWLFGALFGFWYREQFGVYLYPMFDAMCSCQPTMTGLLVATIVPVLTCFILALISKECWVYLVVLIKCFLYSFSVFLILECMDEANLLGFLLINFSNVILLPLQFAFVIRCFDSKKSELIQVFINYCIVAVVVAIVDYLLINSFTISLR